MIMRQVLGLKFSFTTFGHKTIQQNFSWNTFIFLKKIIIKDKYQAKLFCFLLIFSFCRFGIETVISKLWTSVSWSNVRDGCAGGNPRWTGHTWWPTPNGSRTDGRETPPCAEKSRIRETNYSLGKRLFTLKSM